MSPTAISAPIAVPGLRRNMVTICAMTATIMQALDTTIANVALPYMQGTLSASQDQINWVLTSYIVAAAIMTAPVGWIANRFGRKRTFIICSAGFTVASVMCGLAQDINQMVLFRLLQGVFGAALVPLSQAVMLDSYALHERAKAMSIWGMGVMMGPIMGPSLGAWLTETYSWHWVFFVNLPFGIVTVIGLMVFMDETKQDTELRFDWFGFAALAIGIGALQVALDRGEQLGWLESNEIIAEFIIAIVGFYYFFAHSFTTSRPFIQFALFRDRNFLTGCIFMTVMGLVLYSTMALASPYLQNVIGYPIITAGVLLASRGCGTFVAMMLVGRLMRTIEARTLIITGLSLTALSLYWMTAWTDQTGVPEIVTISITQGFGFGLVFVPLSTVAFMTLPNHLRTDGTSMLTLMRNVASSVGISIVIAQLTEGGRRVYAILSEHITPFNHAMQMPNVSSMIDLGTDKGRAMADVMVQLQAQIIAFSQDYQLVMFFILGSIPLAIMIGSTKVALRKQAVGTRTCGDGIESDFLDVEEHRFVVALKTDVEAIDRVAARHPLGDQRAATLGGHQRQNGIGGVGRLSIEIDARVVMQEHAAGENRNQNMRRLRLAVGIGDLPRLDGVERVLAVGAGAAAAKAPEFGVGQRALVLGIGETALRVGLPDFQHAVGNKLPIAVEHLPLDPDSLAGRIRRDEIVREGVVPFVLAGRRQPVGEERTDGL